MCSRRRTVERKLSLLPPDHPPPRNRLLATLSPEDLAHLRPRLEPVDYVLRQVIFERGAPMSSVIFPESGWFSLLIRLEEGDAGEVGLVGREGITGLPFLFDDDRSPAEIIVQGPGKGLRLGVGAFREAVNDSPALHKVLLRYALAFQAQVSQTAACNARHNVEERLARWLLMAHDRADGDTFPMTHEFLSVMLGIRRQGVTVAAGALHRAGLIHYQRGTIEITDRLGLEAASCECHATIRREFKRLLGTPG
jgi:CRP-like cAMP-binding protein